MLHYMPYDAPLDARTLQVDAVRNRRLLFESWQWHGSAVEKGVIALQPKPWVHISGTLLCGSIFLWLSYTKTGRTGFGIVLVSLWIGLIIHHLSLGLLRFLLTLVKSPPSLNEVGQFAVGFVKLIWLCILTLLAYSGTIIGAYLLLYYIVHKL